MAWLNVNELWDRQLYPNNASQPIRDAISGQTRPTLYFPAPTTYYIEDVDLPDHTRLVCDQHAIMRGVTSSSDMFNLTGNEIRVNGGRWRNCRTAFLHTGATSTSSHVFREMNIEHMDIGFDLSICHGSTWQDCTFDKSTKGIHFRPTYTCNVNRLVGCMFDTDDIAVTVENGHKNLIYSCWFENCNDIPVKIVDAENTTISDCWFENNGNCHTYSPSCS